MKDFKSRFNEISERYYSAERLAKLNELKQRLTGRKIVLFGAAWIGDFVWNKLTAMGFPPECFCDNFATGVSPEGHSPIINAAELKKNYSDAIIILTLDKAKNIVYSQLIDMGFSPDQIIKNADSLIATLDMDMFLPHLEGYEWAYNFFEDELSKDIIIQRIACYLLGDSVDKSTSPQYFEDGIVHLNDDEVFVDCGFFTGDTAEEFVRQTGGKFRHIYGFEPDEYASSKAANFIQTHDNVTHIPKGIYSCDTTLKFMSTFGASAASGGNIIDTDAENVIKIQVTSIDNYFADISDKPTFIKMDIEGSEGNALRGAEHTIRNYRPKLAVCVYHKPEDIYVLPKLVSSYRSDYKYCLRHYANYFWETVMYAI